MVEGVYYKEWSAVLDRAMEFKVYGSGGVPVLALPARGGRFYDWENNGMPDSVAPLLAAGKLQLFCADSIDGESLLAEGISARQRAERQEAYFVYLTEELAPRIRALNRPVKKADADNAADGKDTEDAEPADAPLWCAGVDYGAAQAVSCRLRRPGQFAGAIGLSGFYAVGGMLGGPNADLALRNSPPDALAAGLYDTTALAQAEENSLLLCAGQGAYESEALESTRVLYDALQQQGLPAHLEVWGGDVSHDWYWWGKEFGLFAERLFG